MDIKTKDGILLRGIPDGTPDEVIKERIAKIRGEKSQLFAAPTSSLVDKIPLEQSESQPQQQPTTRLAQPSLYSSELVSMTRPIWEPAAAIASGMAGQVAGTLAGVGKELFTGDFGKGTAEKTAKGIMEKMQYQPRSQGGKDALETIGAVFNESKLAGLPMMGNELPMIAQATKQQAPAISRAVSIPGEILDARRLAKQEASAVATRNALPQIETVKKGIEGGYTFNPAKTNPTTGNVIKEHVTGDSRINNAAFEKNQSQANADARTALGQPNGVGLDKKLFNKIKDDATRPYAEIEKIPTIKTDAEFLSNIQGGSWIKDLPPEQQALFKSSPAVNSLIEAASLPEYNGIAAMKYLTKLRNEANATFRATAATDEASALAQAKWTIARELEKNIERQLEAMNKVDPSKGYADLAQRLREGRQKYAEVSAIERATDPLGNVDVLVLAKDKRGDSFSGKLELMKTLGESYPDVFKHHGATIPDVIKRYGIGGVAGGLAGAAVGQPFIGAIAGGALDPVAASLLRRHMVNPAFQTKNAIPADMRPMREQLGYAQNLGPRRIPINRDIPYRLPELNPAATTGPLPTVESIVIPSSWKEGMQPNATGKSAPIGIPDQLLPLSEQYPQGIPIGAAEGRMPVPSTPLPKLPPQERGLLSLEDPATVRVTGKRPQGGLLDFPLRQEVLQKLEPQITAFREEAARLEAIANNKYPITGKPQAEARMQLEQLQKEFAAGMRQLGIDKPQEAIGLQPLFQSGSTTKLPIVKSRGLLDYSKE